GLAAIDPAKPVPRWLGTVEGRALAGLMSVATAPDGRIFAVEGSTARAPEKWRQDLMEKRHSGRLIMCGAALDEATTLLRDLHYPYGVVIAQETGTLWFTESWAHRLSRMTVSGNGAALPEVVLGNLPGYPARLRTDGRGGFYLGLFARRTH